MKHKTVIYHEVDQNGTAKSINSPEFASNDAIYIILEERQQICNSYNHSKFIFIDRNCIEQKIEFLNATLHSVYIDGTAADYVLAIQFTDINCNLYNFYFHNDIRYNIGPLCGPKTFTPRYMEWDRYDPFKTILECFSSIKKFGIEAYNIIHNLQSKVLSLERDYEIKARDLKLLNMGLRHVSKLEFAEGTEMLEPYALEYLYNLDTLVLPSTIKVIPSYSLFSYSIKTIYCKAQHPPKLDFFAFGENREVPSLTIYIPKGSIKEYIEIWKKRESHKTFKLIECLSL